MNDEIGNAKELFNPQSILINLNKAISNFEAKINSDQLQKLNLLAKEIIEKTEIINSFFMNLENSISDAQELNETQLKKSNDYFQKFEKLIQHLQVEKIIDQTEKISKLSEEIEKELSVDNLTKKINIALNSGVEDKLENEFNFLNSIKESICENGIKSAITAIKKFTAEQEEKTNKLEIKKDKRYIIIGVVCIIQILLTLFIIFFK